MGGPRYLPGQQVPTVTPPSGGKVKVSALVGKYDDWDANIAAAIIFAESRGKTNATHKNSNGSIDRGLMQINSIHSQYDAQRLLEDPEYNVSAGHDIWKAAGGSFSPWTTYKTGAYKMFLHHDAEVSVAPGAHDTTVSDVLPSIPNPLSGIEAIGAVIGALANPSTYLRLGKGALGAVLIVVGVGGAAFIIANRVPTPVKAAAKVISK